jgi:hypothetical protein
MSTQQRMICFSWPRSISAIKLFINLLSLTLRCCLRQIEEIIFAESLRKVLRRKVAQRLFGRGEDSETLENVKLSLTSS